MCGEIPTIHAGKVESNIKITEFGLELDELLMEIKIETPKDVLLPGTAGLSSGDDIRKTRSY